MFNKIITLLKFLLMPLNPAMAPRLNFNNAINSMMRRQWFSFQGYISQTNTGCCFLRQQRKKHCNHWQSLVFPLSPAKTFFSPRMQYSPHLSIIHSHLEKNVQIATAITFHMHTLFINSVHALWILCKYPQNTKSQKWDIDELNII